MLVNNNLNICGRLVRRDFRFHRVKNLILILACALVTGLYSFVFLLAGSIEGAYLLNYQYTYGSTSHILYTGLTEHQADILSRDAAIRSSVRLSSVGQLTDAVIGKRQVKLAVTDRDYAETVLSIPTSGRLPEQKGEIALDEFTMDSLGILREEGAPVELSWTDPEGISHTSSFTLCGWWASPTNFSEACAWITEETARDLYPEYDAETARNTTLGVTLYQPRNLEAQAEQLLASQGIAGAGRLNTVLPTLIVSVALLGIALLNFTNMLIIKAVNRRREFAVYESLGMTHSQLQTLLLLEGVFHAALMFLATGPLTFLFARFVMPSVIEGIGSWCMVYTFSVTPLALTLAGVLVLSAAVPLGCLHFISRGSITERLRTAE